MCFFIDSTMPTLSICVHAQGEKESSIGRTDTQEILVDGY